MSVGFGVVLGGIMQEAGVLACLFDISYVEQGTPVNQVPTAKEAGDAEFYWLQMAVATME